jgi:hypothetical protein
LSREIARFGRVFRGIDIRRSRRAGPHTLEQGQLFRH